MGKPASAMTDESLTLENGIRIPGVMVRGKQSLVSKLPPRLQPLRSLLEAQDGDNRAVIDDWLEEQTWNVAHDLWLLTKPTVFHERTTLMVIGRGTKPTHYPAVNLDLARLAIAEAQRQLTIHPHARFVRFIEDGAQASPQGEEVLMDHVFFGGPYPRRRRRKQGAVVPVRPRVTRFRSRCLIAGCVVECVGTQVVEPKSEFKALLYVDGKVVAADIDFHIESSAAVEGFMTETTVEEVDVDEED